MPAGAAAYVDVEDLDARGTLSCAEEVVRARRALDARELQVALHWADLHGQLPGDRPSDGVPRGGPRLTRLGGEGTPEVVDVALCELAVARGTHTLATRAFLADALDLRHRLPRLHRALREGACELWVARRVASMSRPLDVDAAALVDRAVADAVDESAGRLLGLAEAKVMEADGEQARARREAERRRRMVAVSRSDEHGLRTIFARVAAGDAAWLDAVVERVADALEARRDLVPDLPADCTRDELRSVALGWLAHPEDVIVLLSAAAHGADGDDGSEPRSGPEDPRGGSAHRNKVVLYVHLHEAAVRGAACVARVEDVGPQLLEEVQRLLGHARVTVKPVLDLATRVSVNAYEHPQSVRERTHLRCVGDVFPHAASTSRGGDMDHPTAYDPNGPPGQTGDHNAGPLGRRHHRAKTHLGYRCDQTDLGEYVWRTPHGLHRLVDATGTHELDEAEAFRLTHPGALDAALDRVEKLLRRSEVD